MPIIYYFHSDFMSELMLSSIMLLLLSFGIGLLVEMIAAWHLILLSWTKGASPRRRCFFPQDRTQLKRCLNGSLGPSLRCSSQAGEERETTTLKLSLFVVVMYPHQCEEAYLSRRALPPA